MQVAILENTWRFKKAPQNCLYWCLIGKEVIYDAVMECIGSIQEFSGTLTDKPSLTPMSLVVTGTKEEDGAARGGGRIKLKYMRIF